MQREFTVVIEQDEDGYFVGPVPEVKGCHAQARSLDELMVRVREVIELCLDAEGRADEPGLKLVGIQRGVL
jgi:predicted RNase H-like HicB family nuclease